MIRALVLMGGPDAERQVSLSSGRAVAAALRRAPGIVVDEVVIDRPAAGELATLAANADVVFPVLHGPWGEGGELQAMLQEIGVPYVGSGPEASALAMNKDLTKRLVAAAGVRTPEAQVLRVADACTLEPPLVLKPVDDGSSVDLAVCRTRREVESARARIHRSRETLMAERYVPGRELTVAVVGVETFPIVEIIPADGLYDYDAKYERDDTRYATDPDLPAGVAETASRWSLAAFTRLGCRDLARVDFMLQGETLWFLELNTIPGFTGHSLVPMAARARGLDMPALCRRLVELATERAPARRRADLPTP